MPQPKPEPGMEPQTLCFSVAKPIADRARSEMDDGYGAQARWFRRVVNAWWDERDLRAENARLRARNLVLEAAFRKVQTAVHDAAA